VNPAFSRQYVSGQHESLWSSEMRVRSDAMSGSRRGDSRRRAR
jgi:hypothetical protein